GDGPDTRRARRAPGSARRAATDAAPRRALFYFGDDTNDEPALEWVRRHGGFAVAVGRRRSHAPYHVRGPVDVLRAVEWIAREWTARGATRPGDRTPRASGSPKRGRARRRRPA